MSLKLNWVWNWSHNVIWTNKLVLMQCTVSQCCAVYLSHVIHWYKTDTEDKHMVINHMTELLVQQVIRELTCCWFSICSFIVQFPADTFCITSWWLNSVTVLPSGSEGKWRSTNVLCQVDLGLQTGRWCGHRQRTHTQRHIHVHVWEP